MGRHNWDVIARPLDSIVFSNYTLDSLPYLVIDPGGDNSRLGLSAHFWHITRTEGGGGGCSVMTGSYAPALPNITYM